MTDPTITSNLAEQAPWAVAIIFLAMAFLQYMGKQAEQQRAHDKSMEESRILAAKEREQERRAHEMAIANMQAQNMKGLVESIEQTMNSIADAIAKHEESSRQRYERMGVTNDLLTAAKKNMRGR